MNNNNSIIKIYNMIVEDIDKAKKLEDEQCIDILSKTSMLSDLNDQNFSYFVIKLNDDIIGYIATSHVFDTMDILSIVVSKTHQQKGIATKLLYYIFDFAKNLNINKILLEVRISNTKAISLYEKCGFKKISLRKNYYQSPTEDAIIMEKTLELVL